MTQLQIKLHHTIFGDRYLLEFTNGVKIVKTLHKTLDDCLESAKHLLANK